MITALNQQLYQVVSEANEPREIKQWHASNIAKCPREQYFERLKVPPLTLPTGAKILRWDVGHKIEEAIRPHLLKIYPNLISNQRMSSDEYDLTGEFDNFNPETNELIEIKSIHPFGFKYLEKEGRPHLHYILQQHAYVILLNLADIQVDKITFVYIALDGRVLTFSNEVEEKYLANVKARLRTLGEAWETKQPPECICNQKDHPLYKPQMQYCAYRQGRECCSLELIKGVEE